MLRSMGHRVGHNLATEQTTTATSGLKGSCCDSGWLTFEVHPSFSILSRRQGESSEFPIYPWMGQI